MGVRKRHKRFVRYIVGLAKLGNENSGLDRLESTRRLACAMTILSAALLVSCFSREMALLSEENLPLPILILHSAFFFLWINFKSINFKLKYLIIIIDHKFYYLRT